MNRRPINGVEKGSMVLAAFLIIGGTVELIHPVAGFIYHSSEGGGEVPRPSLSQLFEEASETKVRVYGGISVVLGIGVLAAALYRSPEDR